MLRNKTFTNEPIKVSVAMIAYNVGKYLEAAVESVLDQECDFRVELVIGEDCSTDNTRELALSYQEKYPSIIRVLLPKKNQGLTPNCIATINACEGEYVALLDSDDYWTDHGKLEIQIKSLDENKELSGSGHQSEVIYDLLNKENHLFGPTDNAIYNVEDLISHRKFHTSSFIFRKIFWNISGGIPPNISSNERALFPLIGNYGKIEYSNKNMCVYRITGYGLTSRVDYKELETDFNMIPWIKKINPRFPYYKFKSFLHLCAYTYGTKRVPFFPAVKHYLSFVFYSFANFPKNIKDIKWGTIFFFRNFKRPL